MFAKEPLVYRCLVCRAFANTAAYYFPDQQPDPLRVLGQHGTEQAEAPQGKCAHLDMTLGLCGEGGALSLPQSCLLEVGPAPSTLARGSQASPSLGASCTRTLTRCPYASVLNQEC